MTATATLATPSRRLLPLAVLLVGACDSAVPPPSPLVPDPAISALIDRLDRLIATMQTGATPALGAKAPATASATDAVRTPVPGGPPDLESRLAAIEQQLAQLQSFRGNNAMPLASFATAPLKVVAVVDQVDAQLDDESTRAEARRTLIMMTQTEALRRFGAPDHTAVGEHGHPHWYWEANTGDGFGLTFINGIAMHVDS